MRGCFRGLTLTETIWGVFIIATSFLLVAGMLKLGIDSNGRSERNQLATLLATQYMAQVRSWAANTTNFASNWSGIEQNAPDPLHNAYLVNIQSQLQELYSPCSAHELGWNPPDRRVMQQSLRRVRVEVSWDNQPRSRVVLCSLVGAPSDRTLGSLALTPLTPVPNPLLHNQQVAFSVQALDTTNAVIPDIFVHWSQNPVNSSGSLPPALLARNGQQATFRNSYYVNGLTGTTVYGPDGDTIICAQARLAGTTVNATQVLHLKDL